MQEVILEFPKQHLTFDVWLSLVVLYGKAFADAFQFCSCQNPDIFHADTQTLTLNWGKWKFLTLGVVWNSFSHSGM